MSAKRELVLKAFKGDAVARVPVGFWHHFTTEEEWLKGFSNPEIIEKNLKGHQNFLHKVKPDFVKLMSDGYFAYPNPAIHKGLENISDLAGIEPLGADHPWITEQVELVKKIRAGFEEDIVAIYNIFAPVTYFKWLVGEVSGGDDLIANFIDQDAATLKKVLDTIGQDIASLSQRIIKEAGVSMVFPLPFVSFVSSFSYISSFFFRASSFISFALSIVCSVICAPPRILAISNAESSSFNRRICVLVI